MPDLLDVPAAPAAPAAPAQKTLNVSQLPAPVTPAPPPKPGSARDRMRQSLREKAGVEAAPAPAPKAPDKPAETPKPPVEDKPPAEPSKPATDPKAVQPEPAPTDGKKPSPWKLVEQYKERLTKAESELLQVKSSVVPEADRKAITTRLEQAEKRAQELEDEIRHVNYSKSKEFQDKYQKPYEAAWQRAMGELHELTVTDPATQQVRAITANDIMELVGMPLQKAREVANAVFGDFADDVMGHRTEIKRLFHEQTQALEEAKKTGAERETKRKEDYQRMYGDISKTTKQIWDAVNSTILEDPATAEYFKPREGDEDWNQRLGKGFQLVDRAYSENPMDPRLTPEQRHSVIKRHAAVRNRAAGWGPLKFENGKLKAKVTELEGELKKYKESTPAAGGTVTAPQTVKTGSAREQLHQSLRALVK